MKSRFQYQKRTREDIKERANNRGGNFDSIFKSQYKVYKVREGKNVVRVLPPTWDKAKHYGLDIYVNYGIGVDNQSYLSLSKMKNQKDPIAEARIVASREGDEKLARALQARQRIVMWIIDRNAEDEGPQIWAAPVTVDKDMASLSFDEDTKEVSYIDDPQNGRDFRFYKEGEGLLTKYPAAKMKLLTDGPLHEDSGLVEEWLEYVANNPLPDVLQFYDYDHISTVFDGQARIDEDEDTPPRRTRQSVRNEPEEAPRAAAKNNGRLEEVEDEGTPPPRRPAPQPEDKPRPSIREQLAARHRAAAPKSNEVPFDEDD